MKNTELEEARRRRKKEIKRLFWGRRRNSRTYKLRPAIKPLLLAAADSLVLITTFSERSHLFTIPSIQPRLRLMLAETPSPHGSGASQETVGTVSEGSVRVVTSPHILVGYC